MSDRITKRDFLNGLDYLIKENLFRIDHARNKAEKVKNGLYFVGYVEIKGTIYAYRAFVNQLGIKHVEEECGGDFSKFPWEDHQFEVEKYYNFSKYEEESRKRRDWIVSVKAELEGRKNFLDEISLLKQKIILLELLIETKGIVPDGKTALEEYMKNLREKLIYYGVTKEECERIKKSASKSKEE